jgi:hypothetical protein
MIKNWLITGDTHGRTNSRLHEIDTSKYIPEETAIIILGDAGINFYLNKTDRKNKEFINKSGFHVYAVRGNHEQRPQNILGMERDWDMLVSGPVHYEPDFPRIRYFVDGGEYIINGYSVLTIGGAYSVDKWYRLSRAGYCSEEAETADPKKCGWFKEEMLTEKEMQDIENKCKGKSYDFVLAHTCPLRWEPTDLFLSGIDQSKVDKSMEKWLDDFIDKINWKIFLFGHYHQDRLERPKVEMYFKYIENIETIWDRWYDENTIKEEWWLPKSPHYNWN